MMQYHIQVAQDISADKDKDMSGTSPRPGDKRPRISSDQGPPLKRGSHYDRAERERYTSRYESNPVVQRGRSPRRQSEYDTRGRDRSDSRSPQRGHNAAKLPTSSEHRRASSLAQPASNPTSNTQAVPIKETSKALGQALSDIFVELINDNTDVALLKSQWTKAQEKMKKVESKYDRTEAQYSSYPSIRDSHETAKALAKEAYESLDKKLKQKQGLLKATAISAASAIVPKLLEVANNTSKKDSDDKQFEKLKENYHGLEKNFADLQKRFDLQSSILTDLKLSQQRLENKHTSFEKGRPDIEREYRDVQATLYIMRPKQETLEANVRHIQAQLDTFKNNHSTLSKKFSTKFETAQATLQALTPRQNEVEELVAEYKAESAKAVQAGKRYIDAYIKTQSNTSQTIDSRIDGFDLLIKKLSSDVTVLCDYQANFGKWKDETNVKLAAAEERSMRIVPSTLPTNSDLATKKDLDDVRHELQTLLARNVTSIETRSKSSTSAIPSNLLSPSNDDLTALVHKVSALEKQVCSGVLTTTPTSAVQTEGRLQALDARVNEMEGQQGVLDEVLGDQMNLVKEHVEKLCNTFGMKLELEMTTVQQAISKLLADFNLLREFQNRVENQLGQRHIQASGFHQSLPTGQPLGGQPLATPTLGGNVPVANFNTKFKELDTRLTSMISNAHNNFLASVNKYENFDARIGLLEDRSEASANGVYNLTRRYDSINTLDIYKSMVDQFSREQFPELESINILRLELHRLTTRMSELEPIEEQQQFLRGRIDLLETGQTSIDQTRQGLEETRKAVQGYRDELSGFTREQFSKNRAEREDLKVFQSEFNEVEKKIQGLRGEMVDQLSIFSTKLEDAAAKLGKLEKTGRSPSSRQTDGSRGPQSEQRQVVNGSKGKLTSLRSSHSPASSVSRTNERTSTASPLGSLQRTRNHRTIDDETDHEELNEKPPSDDDE